MPEEKTKRASRLSKEEAQQVRQVEQLLVDGQIIAALEILAILAARHSDHIQILEKLAEVSHTLGSHVRLEHALRCLHAQKPDDQGLYLELADSHEKNERMALALTKLQEFLLRWPLHPLADDIRKKTQVLEDLVRQEAIRLKIDEHISKELLIQHDELRYCLQNCLLSQGRLVGERLHRHFPNFVPAMNNLAQIYAIDGLLDKAIKLSEQVLLISPENIVALSALSRYHFLAGHPQQAGLFAGRLKKAISAGTVNLAAVAETLYTLGDYQGILDLYKQAKQNQLLESTHANGYFYHLSGTAACRLNMVELARMLWIKAIKVDPGMVWAQQNLDDLEKPLHERNGAWGFSFEYWLLGKKVKKLSNLTRRPGGRGDISIYQEAVKNYVQAHPELVFLVPHLLERGDVATRQFVFHLAVFTALPEIVEPVKKFISGKQGSYQLRQEAAFLLADAHLLPENRLKLWRGKELREVSLHQIEIYTEREDEKLPAGTQHLMETAIDLINQRKGKEACEVLEKALKKIPDNPTLWNNLCVALALKGEEQKARELIKEVYQRFPDYFFGIISMVRMALEEGNIERAHELLNSLMTRKRLHIAEYTSLCCAQMETWLADNQPEEAKRWLELLEEVDPEHPHLGWYREKILTTQALRYRK